MLPQRAPLSDAGTLVEQHARWLDRHLARVHQERARLAVRPRLGEGRTLLVAGEPTRISAVDRVLAAAGAWRRRADARVGSWCASDVMVGSTAELLEAWLRDRARHDIGQRVGCSSFRDGRRTRPLSIRDQSSRWASASGSGALSFSWRLILAPPFVLDAVVVHELGPPAGARA